MRPTPDEVILGIRSILKMDIAPSVPKHARMQLKRVMAVLRDGQWNEAAFDLLRENAAFTELARQCAGRIDGADDLHGILGTVSSALRASAEQTVPASFAAANATNRLLREALCHFIEIVRDRQLTAFDDLCAAIWSSMLTLRAAG